MLRSMAAPRHFSMIRELRLADVFTLANGFAGMGAVLATLQFVATEQRGYLRLAFLLLPVALVMDFADGRIARWRQKVSPLGQELDSLADLVSFGVAPAALGFAIGLRGGWDALVFLYFVGCGISRLARYNVTAASLAGDGGKVRYFEGTPIPTSLAIVALLGVLFSMGRTGVALPLGEVLAGPWRLHPLVLVYAASGSAMISKTLRIPKP
jgi:CDP-diacylglycerol--serine O-phosphatidyltransferase